MESSISRASQFCRARNLKPNLAGKLGQGQDGEVWEVSDKTAIKVFDREGAFLRELECYLILKQNSISAIRAFNVPELIGFDRQLYVIQITIVKPPYILDFGKAYCYEQPAQHTEEAMSDYQTQIEEFFGESLEEVELAIAKLRSVGIYYVDIRPGNINCQNLPRSNRD